MSTLESVRRQALALPEEERHALLAELAASVELALSPEWQAEIQRRLKAIDEGTAVFWTEDEADRLIFGKDED